MSLDIAIRLTEILLAFALIQESIEHIYGPRDEQKLFLPRMILSALLLAGLWTKWILLALFINGILTLKRFQGPYNGGSDRMKLLILSCLCLASIMPALKEYIFAYLALQLVLSYFLAGWVKIVNPDWRNGQSLKDLFAFSAFPVSENLRALAQKPRILFLMSWSVLLFELAFPLALLSQSILVYALFAAAIFHLANSYLFGFNRFFWVWLAAYPSIIWFQNYLLLSYTQ